RFTSNKQSVRSIQSNSSLRKELDRYKKYLTKIHLYPNELESAERIIDDAREKLTKLNEVAKSTSAVIADDILSDSALFRQIYDAMRTAPPSDKHRRRRYQKYVVEMFSPNFIKYKDKTGRLVEYMRRAGWTPGKQISTNLKLRAFLEYAKEDSFTKDAS